MIKLLRVDDNLLHGQVAFSWVRNLNIHMIIIADDQVAKDEFVKMTLGLSKPIGVILVIESIEDAIQRLKEHQDTEMNVMGIVNSIENAERILMNVSTVKNLNIGLLRTTKPIVYQYENIYLDQQDIHTCIHLLQQGVEIEMRLRYDDKKVKLTKENIHI